MQPTPSSPSVSSSSGSIQRLSSEYDGWWMRSGVPSASQDLVRLARLLRRVRRDARVERAARAHRRVERAHRLLERRLRIEAVRVEDVDVVEPHARERLVERREQVLARAPLAVRAGPHVVAGLRRDHELVAVRAEVVAQHPAERLLGRAVRRPVVVRQVEVRDAEVERAAEDRAARLVGRSPPKLCQRPSEIAGSFSPLGRSGGTASVVAVSRRCTASGVLARRDEAHVRVADAERACPQARGQPLARSAHWAERARRCKKPPTRRPGPPLHREDVR